MNASKRVLSIDVMRGITLFLMLFVNDLFEPGVPDWLTHRPADYDGMGLADWVFPGFLFMVGMAVPFAVQSRMKKGDSTRQIAVHILLRSLSLLLIGVLMLNAGRVNAELTGIPKELWAILMYVSVFLIWNIYPENKAKLALALKIIGFVGLAALLVAFRAGTSDETSWLVTSWWGILGLIGWGYLATSLVYLWLRDSLTGTALAWLFFVALNILSQLGLLSILEPIKTVFGVLIDGNVPSIVLAGLFFSLLLRRLKTDQKKFIWVAGGLGAAVLVTGFVLRNWFILSKIWGTPSWAMVCNGISILLFVLLFLVIDVWGKSSWTRLFRLAGQNSLTTYLAPDILYYAIWMSSVPVLVYKQDHSVWLAIGGSLLWSFVMIIAVAGLGRIGVRLKL